MLLSSFLDFLFGKIQRLTHRKILMAIVLIFIIVVFTNGISLVPPEHYQKLSQNPFITRTDIDSHNYWQETVLLPVIAYFTHLNSRIAFNILCLFIAITAYFLFANFSFKRYGAVTLIFTTILITSPLTTIILAWLGTPDGLTFAITVPFLFINSSYLIFFLSVLGTMNHATFIIAASEVLILRWIARDGIKGCQLIAATTGGAIGYFLVKVFLTLNQIQAMTRLGFILSKNPISWIKMNTSNPPMTIFSLFNIHWLIIFFCLILFFRKDKFYYSSIIVLLLFNYGIVFFTEDTTRIFSLLSWGILMECIFHSYELSLNNNDGAAPYQKQLLQALIVIGFISLVTPRYYSWNGEIHTAPFYSFLKQIIK